MTHQISSETAQRREPSIHSPWRRSACDRCRSQKLRCVRNADDTKTHCIRCTRMSLDCITSSAKSQARGPRKAHGGVVSRDGAEPAWSQNRNDTANLTDATLINRVSEATPESLSLSLPSCGHEYISSAMGEDTPMPSGADDASNANLFNFTLSNGGLLSSQLNTAHDTIPTSAPSLSSFGMTSAPDFDLFSSFGGQDLLSHLPPSYTTAQDEDASQATDSVDSDPGIQLAKLQQSLARQLALVKTTDWDISNLVILAGACEHDSRTYNPLASILASTGEFLAVLTLFNSSTPTHASRSSLETQPPSTAAAVSSVAAVPSSSPPIVHVLGTISCYVLIVSILDYIFTHILDEVQRGDGAESKWPLDSSATKWQQTGAAVLFAGHSVSLTTQLGSRLVVQLVEYQMELLEQAFGLPADYCISIRRRSDSEKGRTDGNRILGRQEAKSLVQALFHSDGSRDDDNVSAIVRSLRESLDRAQRGLEPGSS